LFPSAASITARRCGDAGADVECRAFCMRDAKLCDMLQLLRKNRVARKFSNTGRPFPVPQKKAIVPETVGASFVTLALGLFGD